ncbi:hypothetical protein [Methylobacterium sp. JK268]
MDDAPRIPAAYRLLAGLPLPWRRRGLGWGLAAAGLVGRWRGRRQGLGLADLLQTLLRMPRREALRLDRAAYRHDVAAEVEWCALHRRSVPAILRDLARAQVEEPDLFRRAAASGRPVILAPLHMGGYVTGLACAMVRYFPGRPLVVLRQRDDMSMETEVIGRLREVGIDVRFLTVTNRADFLPAVRFARDARAVLVVFCDLPPAYGAPAAMPMFGRPFRFAFGVDTLARLTGALVMPLATTLERDRDVIRPGQPFEVRGSGPQERAEVAEIMRRHLRAAIEGRPEQWHLWSSIAEYLPESDNLPTNPPEGEGTPQILAA